MYKGQRPRQHIRILRTSNGPKSSMINRGIRTKVVTIGLNRPISRAIEDKINKLKKQRNGETYILLGSGVAGAPVTGGVSVPVFAVEAGVARGIRSYQIKKLEKKKLKYR